MKNLKAIVVCGVSAVLNIVGLAIPYWNYMRRNIHGVDYVYNRGLWQQCYSFADKSACISIEAAQVGALNEVRAMEVMGLLLIIGALVCLCLKQFIMKEKQHLPKVGSGSAILAGLLMIVGTIMYATSSVLNPRDINLHGGFFLCVIAGTLSIFTGAGLALMLNRYGRN